MTFGGEVGGLGCRIKGSRVWGVRVLGFGIVGLVIVGFRFPVITYDMKSWGLWGLCIWSSYTSTPDLELEA